MARPSAAERSRTSARFHAIAAAALVAWAAAQLVWFRPHELAADWNGWRQADTQSIALGFLQHGDGVLYPRIRWGGDGPGFVETELALYPFLIGQAMRVFGANPAIGQLLSLGFATGAALALALLLRARFGALSALAGLAAFLSSKALAFVATSVQPEALCVFACVLALAAFLRWAEAPDRYAWLVAYGVLVSLACLVKPTAMQLLFAPLLVAAWEPELRRRWPALLCTYLVIGALGGAYLLHARSLYLEYGNTFGLLSGGDRKTPRLEHLVHPKLYLNALRVFLDWGFGLCGIAAALILIVRRRFDRWLLALLAAAGLWALASLRYSVSELLGSHYTVLGALAAAWATALCVRELAQGEGPRRSVALGLLALGLLAQLTLSYSKRYASAHPDLSRMAEVRLGRELARVAEPETLVVVRANASSRNDFWKTANNFQDPTVMYLSWTRGWIMPNDDASPALLQQALGRGARYFVDPDGTSRGPAVDTWLEANGRRVTVLSNAEIWALNPPSTGTAFRIP